MGRYGHGHAVGGNSLPRLGERVPALRARPVVPQEMAPERPGWRSDHRPLRRRYRCRVPTQAGCGAVPPRRSGEAGPVRSQPPPGQDPPRGVWPVRGFEPAPARGGQAGDFRLSGPHALLHDDPERTLSAWSQTGRQTGQQDPGAHRRGAPQALAPHDIWEVGRWLGRVCEAWLNYFAVPGSGRFIRAFLRRLQRRWMRALRRRSQRARFSWKRLERMTEILWPRASIRHPWPDQRFAVKHPR